MKLEDALALWLSPRFRFSAAKTDSVAKKLMDEAFEVINKHAMDLLRKREAEETAAQPLHVVQTTRLGASVVVRYSDGQVTHHHFGAPEQAAALQRAIKVGA